MRTLTQAVSIWREVHKSKTGKYIFSKLRTYVQRPFSKSFSQKKKKKNLNWGVHVNFLSFRNTLMHIYRCLQKGHELRGRNSTYCSYKTNILDFELGEGPWNYMKPATQVKHDPAQFSPKLCTTPVKPKFMKYGTKALSYSKMVVILKCLALIWRVDVGSKSMVFQQLPRIESWEMTVYDSWNT